MPHFLPCGELMFTHAPAVFVGVTVERGTIQPPQSLSVSYNTQQREGRRAVRDGARPAAPAVPHRNNANGCSYLAILNAVVARRIRADLSPRQSTKGQQVEANAARDKTQHSFLPAQRLNVAPDKPKAERSASSSSKHTCLGKRQADAARAVARDLALLCLRALCQARAAAIDIAFRAVLLLVDAEHTVQRTQHTVTPPALQQAVVNTHKRAQEATRHSPADRDDQLTADVALGHQRVRVGTRARGYGECQKRCGHDEGGSAASAC